MTEEGKIYLVYGIKVWQKIKNKYVVTEFLPDIFFDYKKAKNFVNLCNSLEISLVHLMDLIEDELS